MHHLVVILCFHCAISVAEGVKARRVWSRAVSNYFDTNDLSIRCFLGVTHDEMASSIHCLLDKKLRQPL